MNKWVFWSKDNDLVFCVYFSHPFSIGTEVTVPVRQRSILPGVCGKKPDKEQQSQQDSASNHDRRSEQLSPQLCVSCCLCKPQSWHWESFLSDDRLLFSFVLPVSPGPRLHQFCPQFEVVVARPCHVVEPLSHHQTATQLLVEKTARP